MTKQIIVNVRPDFGEKRPAKVVTFEQSSRETREKFYYETEGVYDTDFKKEPTPSIERAVNCILDHETNHAQEINRLIKRIHSKWKNKKGITSQSMSRVNNKFGEYISNGSEGIALLAITKTPKSLKKRQRTYFRELADTVKDYLIEQEYSKFALASSPCFFEPSDFDGNLELLLRPNFYFRDEKHYGTSSKYVRLREIKDRGQRGQRVEAQVSLSDRGKLNLKYIVYNRNDKLDVVVRIEDEKLVLNHYDIVRKTPRGEDGNPDQAYQIIRSGREGNFLIKAGSGSDEKLFHRGKDELEASEFFKFLERYPVFYGGNGFIHTSDFVMENMSKITKVAQSARAS
ncbi:hypothetical protein CMI46_01025 [Candidatus Pacearchaeota archaeon]|nr:hypothetical protein [Candidatus Pacearchaeota archaeon]|tara:strand:+ start:303 stop:1334 length:1032 start_codon:yes stop_codon:yes gene_type:complete